MIMMKMKMKRYRDEEADTDSINNLANVLMLLSRGDHETSSSPPPDVGGRRVFECKTCNRQFQSFQALGGHRASHKKPKSASLGTSDQIRDDDKQVLPAKPKIHECAICGLEFAVGQALGGHMRRHRAGGNFVEKKSSSNGKRVLLLDLNLPPLELEDDVEGRKLLDSFHLAFG